MNIFLLIITIPLLLMTKTLEESNPYLDKEDIAVLRSRLTNASKFIDDYWTNFTKKLMHLAEDMEEIFRESKYLKNEKINSAYLNIPDVLLFIDYLMELVDQCIVWGDDICSLKVESVEKCECVEECKNIKLEDEWIQQLKLNLPGVPISFNEVLAIRDSLFLPCPAFITPTDCDLLEQISHSKDNEHDVTIRENTKYIKNLCTKKTMDHKIRKELTYRFYKDDQGFKIILVQINNQYQIQIYKEFTVDSTKTDVIFQFLKNCAYSENLPVYIHHTIDEGYVSIFYSLFADDDDDVQIYGKNLPIITSGRFLDKIPFLQKVNGFVGKLNVWVNKHFDQCDDILNIENDIENFFLYLIQNEENE